MRVAAIDVGTNTTRLLVAEHKSPGNRYRDLDRRLRFTRLGEGVDAAGRLQFVAMKRTLAAVAEFLAVCGEFGVEKVRVAGTSALRDARNSDEFLSGVAKLAAVKPEILGGEEEARLSFSGATAALPDGVYVVCDIGGGSTELVGGSKGPAGEFKAISVNLGAVRLTERFLLSDPAAPEEMVSMEAAIESGLAEADSVMPPDQAQLVGLAGSVTTLAAMYLGLESYDPEQTHEMVLPRAAVDSLYLDLARRTSKERSSIPGLIEGRADIIVAGTSILAKVMSRWSFDQLIVSERDILDGLVLEIIGENRD
ncbi:MAG: exopolyphosphatase [Actinomycetota bacterium]